MDDPGWRGTWGSAIPFYGLLTAHRLRNRGITTIRAVFIAFVAAVLLFGAVQGYVAAWDTPSIALLAFIAALGIVALAVVMALRRRPLNSTSAEALASSFVTSFFLMMAAAEFVAVIGFGLALAVDRAQIYWVAAAFTLVGFRIAAPDRAEVIRRQNEIAITGSSLSLLTALENRPRPSP